MQSASTDEQAREWLSDLIRFRSVQGDEAEAQEYILKIAGEIGAQAEKRPIPDDLMNDPEYSHNENEMSYEGRPNVVAVRKGTGGGRSLIMQSHTDVIPEAEWTEAWTPKWDGDPPVGSRRHRRQGPGGGHAHRHGRPARPRRRARRRPGGPSSSSRRRSAATARWPSSARAAWPTAL